MNDKEYKYFIQEFKKIANLDISLYKEDQMKRRISNFLKKEGLKSGDDLFKRIRTDRELLERLKSNITINVTEFMRNKQLWRHLLEKVVPKIIENKKRLMFWSAACSSGEEPYTIAILMDKLYPEISVNIVATDIDAEILNKAKEGVYLKKDILPLGNDVLSKYFDDLGNNKVKINDYIKNKVRFKQHNLLGDPFPTAIDIIVCRNVLIYFKDEAKNEIYKKFSSSLNENGVLFIGATEQIFEPQKFGFKSIGSFFYEKVD